MSGKATVTRAGWRRVGAWGALWLTLAVAGPAAAQYPLRLPPRPNVPPAPLPPVTAAPEPRPVAGPVRSAEGDLALLPGVLRDLDPQFVLRITLLSREVIDGHPYLCAGDTLWLDPPGRRERPAGPDTRPPLRAAVYVPDIVRVQQWRTASEHGAAVGARSGMVAGGLAGLVLGLAFTGLGDADGGFPIVVACTFSGAAASSVVGSLLGTGLGAAGHHWYGVWPEAALQRRADAQAAAAEAARGAPTLTRIVMEAGYADSGEPFESTGLALGLGLLGAPAGGLEFGPVLRFNALGGPTGVPATETSRPFVQLDPVASLSLDARLARPGAGWRPWAEGGFGIAVGDGPSACAHAGLGLRWRAGGGRDFGLAVRRHFVLGHVVDAVDGYWTVGAVVSFAP